MLSRIMKFSVVVAVGALLQVGSARAVPVYLGELAPDGGVLVAGGLYHGTWSPVGPFDHIWGATPIVPLGTTSVAFDVGSGGFGSITLQWLKSDFTAESLPVSGLEVELVHTFTAAGHYYLNVSGLTLGGFKATYTALLEASAVPLPPALILFGTALVGMTLLGRRRRSTRPPAI